ncbi:restriction endonuclease subunit S [Xanthomonas cissicola]|nr:restriction endonuclease subunit S [Xanthomonas cissicola]KAB0535405.1 restriction endonuclease subunit S [Xanthomonas cissicola]
MEVKPGYKQTDVGMIPEEWGVESVLGISQRIMDYRGRTPRKLGMSWGGGDIPALSAGNVKKGFIDFSAECYFASNELWLRWMTQGGTEKGDVLFTTEAPLGNVALVPDDRKYILSQRTILVRGASEKALNGYIFQVLLSEKFQKNLLDYSSGSTAKGIQRRGFEKLEIAVPKIEEQREIVTALSDMDALLDGLDRLIAKKRAIKQAAMQQLLTGQTRLPGFSGTWEVIRLGDLAEIRSGGTPSTRDSAAWDGAVPWCTPTDITALEGGKYLAVTNRTITEHGLRNSSAELIPARSIVMTSRATIGECAINVVPMATNQGFKNLVPFDAVDAEFFYYLLCAQTQGLVGLSAGSTFLEIGKAQIRQYEVRLPSTKIEQAAISAVLGDMDAESVHLRHVAPRPARSSRQ